MLDTIFGPQEIFGEGELRKMSLPRINELAAGIGGIINTHQHLGSACPLRELQAIGRDNGISGVHETLEDFTRSLVNVPGGNLGKYIERAYHLAEDIQSGKTAVQSAVKAAVEWAEESTGSTFLGSEIGRQKIFEYGGMEIRFDPMKRNKPGVGVDRKTKKLHFELDSIISHAYRGADLDYRKDRQVGFIICLAKNLQYTYGEGPLVRHERNLILADRISQWSKIHPILSVDLTDDEKHMRLDSPEERNEVKEWYDIATNGNKVKRTIHIAETNNTTVDAFIKVLELIKPDRIGHGVEMIKQSLLGNSKGLECAKEKNVVFELCMYSNLCTGAVSNVKEFNLLVQELDRFEIPYVFATDGTCTHSFDEKTTSRRNGHQGVTLADEIVMMFLAGQSEELIRQGLRNSQEYTFLNDH